MIRDIHPADELALLRADIERLQSREAVLRRAFSGDPFADAVVFKSRRFEYNAKNGLVAHQTR